MPTFKDTTLLKDYNKNKNQMFKIELWGKVMGKLYVLQYPI